MINHTYGPSGKFIRLTALEPDMAVAELGYSVSDEKLLLIKEALKGASTVYAYILAGASEKAKASGGGINAEAKYGGSRGNDFKFSVVADPEAEGTFIIKVYIGATLKATYEGIKTASDINALSDEYIIFTAEEDGKIAEAASVSLTGGSDKAATNDEYTKFLDALETVRCNSFAFPVDGEDTEALKAAAKEKAIHLSENCGRRIHAAIPNYAADCQYIINVTNGVVLADGTEIDAVKATAWAAAVYAGATDTKSNTYEPYPGAVDIIGIKGSDAAIRAIKNGEFFFSFDEEDRVVVEYDINSLVTLSEGMDESYKKNRLQRVIDFLCSDIKIKFPPNKFDNVSEGWDVMDGLGADMLLQKQKAGALKNVDPATDFLVDRSASKGDSTLFNVFIQGVDSSEKLYLQIWTN